MQSKIILVGVGGTGMSGIAGMLHDLGYKNLIGTDSDKNQLTKLLEDKNIHILYTNDVTNIINPGDTVIYSAATYQTPTVQKALMFAQDYKKPMIVMSYFEFLGEISKYYHTIAIAGTNGKSTTTALTIFAMQKYCPNVAIGILGALVPNLSGTNYYLNHQHIKATKNIFDYIITGKGLQTENIKKYYFVVEACEYKRHFLHLDPDYTLITSLELDHTDYYHNIQDYKNAFIEIIRKTKKKVLIARHINKNRIPKELQKKCILVKKQIRETKYVFGEHYAINIPLVERLLDTIGCNYDTHVRNMFRGLRRRLEYIGTNKNKAKIYSDYGHIPSSLRIVYTALKHKFPDKKVCIIFQPHQARRVVEYWHDFIKVIRLFDQAYIYKIYTARENKEQKYTVPGLRQGTEEQLAEYMATKVKGIYINSPKQLEKIIHIPDKNRIIAVCTAGDVDYLLRNMTDIMHVKK